MKVLPYQMICGDCLQVMPRLEAASVDAIVTDPPYGLSKEPDIREVLQHWLRGDHYEHDSNGFMGENWDAFVPGPEYWKEVFRVLKPGGHLVAFSGTRTFDLLSIAVRMAGFEIRDDITVIGSSRLLWIYSQGLPKSEHVGRAIDRTSGFQGEVIETREMVNIGSNSKADNYGPPVRKPVEVKRLSSEAAKWEGFGSQLKPSHEPILLARKPLDGTIANNVLRHGTGALNVDGCRVGFANVGDETEAKDKNRHADFQSGPRSNRVYGQDNAVREKFGNWNPSGRWPPNVLLLHLPGCVNEGLKQVPSDGHWANGRLVGYGANIGQGGYEYLGPGVQPKTEWREAWTCAPGCPVTELDRQTKDLRPSKEEYVRKSDDRGFDGNDAGGSSRFFPQFQGVEGSSGFLYVPKASRNERDEGLPECHHYDAQKAAKKYDDIPPRCPTCQGYPLGNTHVTIKPIELCRWLVRLVTPPGGVVPDPFAGSGSIGIASRLEGMGFVGIELKPEHVEIANYRMVHHGQVQAVIERAKREQRNLFDF